jgi:hypothetical protein
MIQELAEWVPIRQRPQATRYLLTIGNQTKYLASITKTQM